MTFSANFNLRSAQNTDIFYACNANRHVEQFAAKINRLIVHLNQRGKVFMIERGRNCVVYNGFVVSFLAEDRFFLANTLNEFQIVIAFDIESRANFCSQISVVGVDFADSVRFVVIKTVFEPRK